MRTLKERGRHTLMCGDGELKAGLAFLGLSLSFCVISPYRSE